MNMGLRCAEGAVLTVENNKMRSNTYPSRHVVAVFLDYWHKNLFGKLSYRW